jgi:hypothetical protein
VYCPGFLILAVIGLAGLLCGLLNLLVSYLPLPVEP